MLLLSGPLVLHLVYNEDYVITHLFEGWEKRSRLDFSDFYRKPSEKTKRKREKQGWKNIGTVYTGSILHCVWLGVTALLSNPDPRARKTSNWKSRADGKLVYSFVFLIPTVKAWC